MRAGESSAKENRRSAEEWIEANRQQAARWPVATREAAHVGWIKFDPANGGVTIDESSGEFDGYAWGENIGWIHSKGTAANMMPYGVAIGSDEYRTYLPLVSR